MDERNYLIAYYDIIGFMTDLIKTVGRANLTDKEIGILLNAEPDTVKRLMDGKQRLNKIQDDQICRACPRF